MRHGIRYEGSFEQNFATRSHGAGKYVGQDGAPHAVTPWPDQADGLRFGFMEQRGKKFFAVRVAYRDEEVLLQHPVRLDPARHLGGRRFVARPMPISKASAGALLGDIIDSNREQSAELSALRARVRSELSTTQAAPQND